MPDSRNLARPRSVARLARLRPLHACVLGLGLVVALASALPAFAAKKSYRYEEDPIRRGRKALVEGRLEDAKTYFTDAVTNEWQVADARFGLGEILRTQGMYAEAETMYRQAILDKNKSDGGAPFPEANAALGLVLQRQGRGDEAKREFAAALAQKGGLWEANFGMARILMAEKKWDEAMVYVDKGKGKKGVSEGEDLYRFGLATVQFATGKVEDAEKNALMALNLNPNESDYSNLVGEIYIARKAPTLAIQAIEAALASPGVIPTPRMHQNLGQLYEGEKQYTDALRHYKEAMQTDSTFAPAFKSAGRLYNLATRYQDAIPYYLKYTGLRPDDAEGQFGLAEAYFKLGTYRKALEVGDRAFALDSTDTKVRLLLARSSFQLNDMPRAEKLYATVADTGRYEAADWTKLAQIAVGQKKYARGDTLITIALAKDSTQADAYAAKGKIYLAAQKADSARIQFEHSLTLAPGSTSTKINLGIAYLQLKRPLDAAKVLREAVTATPDFVQARVFLAQALVSADSLGSALSEYKRATELDPKNGGALRGAAFIHMKRGEYAQAVSLLKQATEVDPKNADSWVVLGQAYAGMNNIGEAIKSVEKGLEINPNQEQGKKILPTLKQIQQKNKAAGK